MRYSSHLTLVMAVQKVLKLATI